MTPTPRTLRRQGPLFRPDRRAVLIGGAALLATAARPHAQDRTLRVTTYDSFASDYGPGPGLAKGFAGEGAVVYTALEDAAAMLSRLRLEGSAAAADVVVGLDTNLMAEARASGLFAPYGVALEGLSLPEPWTDPDFVPFDYGWFAFVYDTQAISAPPRSFEDLIAAPPAVKIIIQDPRTSTPGLGLLLWVKALYGAGAAEIWKALAPRILTVTRGWSEAYGLFLKGEAPMVLSYTTSPAYHRAVENVTRYDAAMFDAGHYLQIEIAGMLAAARDPDLARAFLRHLVSEAGQAVIPETNWMYPVRTGPSGPPASFRALPTPARTLRIAPEEVAANRAAWIAEWETALAR
jgi:thiamine transport system substrate-binding protein